MTSFNNLLTIVVSLAEAEQRRADIERKLSSKITYSVLNAVNGRQIPAGEYFEYNQRRKGRAAAKKFITPGELGCTLSHIKALKTFISSSYEFLMVLEDDISICDLTLLPALLGHYKYSRSINILGGQQGLKRPRMLSMLTLKPPLYFSSHLAGYFLYRTCCYLISREVAVKLLSAYLSGVYLADDWGRLARAGNIDAFSYTPIFSHPTDLSQSAIESER